MLALECSCKGQAGGGGWSALRSPVQCGMAGHGTQRCVAPAPAQTPAWVAGAPPPAELPGARHPQNPLLDPALEGGLHGHVGAVPQGQVKVKLRLLHQRHLRRRGGFIMNCRAGCEGASRPEAPEAGACRMESSTTAAPPHMWLPADAASASCSCIVGPAGAPPAHTGDQRRRPLAWMAPTTGTRFSSGRSVMRTRPFSIASSTPTCRGRGQAARGRRQGGGRGWGWGRRQGGACAGRQVRPCTCSGLAALSSKPAAPMLPTSTHLPQNLLPL